MAYSKNQHIAGDRRGVLIYGGMNIIPTSLTGCRKQPPHFGPGPAQGSGRGHVLDESVLHSLGGQIVLDSLFSIWSE